MCACRKRRLLLSTGEGITSLLRTGLAESPSIIKVDFVRQRMDSHALPGALGAQGPAQTCRVSPREGDTVITLTTLFTGVGRERVKALLADLPAPSRVTAAWPVLQGCRFPGDALRAIVFCFRRTIAVASIPCTCRHLTGIKFNGYFRGCFELSHCRKAIVCPHQYVGVLRRHTFCVMV